MGYVCLSLNRNAIMHPKIIAVLAWLCRHEIGRRWLWYLTLPSSDDPLFVED